MLETTNVQAVVEDEIRALSLEEDGGSGPLGLDDSLVELGLNSLFLAQLLIQLELELGVDPFEDRFSITDMRTVRDLVNAYEKALDATAVV
ncbi:phosphopantetheine-binding protein [Streptomyces sp. NPDC050738]|uniref:phosphopantetheine-binding protein n=1 Tax=Streptomyces sp. NPDC050738 TaxID=3154744 RepID=UPI00342E32A4